MNPDKHAEYLRRRRMESTDFKLYEAAKMQASRFKKAAEDATKKLDVFTAWPLRDGYLVANGDFIEPVGPAFWERRS
jgi:hypothetical protein